MKKNLLLCILFLSLVFSHLQQVPPAYADIALPNEIKLACNYNEKEVYCVDHNDGRDECKSYKENKTKYRYLKGGLYYGEGTPPGSDSIYCEQSNTFLPNNLILIILPSIALLSIFGLIYLRRKKVDRQQTETSTTDSSRKI